MKIGDLVKYEGDQAYTSVGVIVAESPYDRLLADAFVVLWQSGEIVQRVPPRILEVIR